MNRDKLTELIKNKNIIIPLYIYKMFPKLDIDFESFMFLMYLYNKGNLIQFDMNKLSEEFSCDTKKIMKYFSNLQEKNIIDIKVIKNDKKIMEEFISLDGFYEKITMNIINENAKEDSLSDKDEIFQMLEKDVGLQLSAVEVEIVKAWNYDIDIIKEAIKEAIKNKVASIRYIDKILFNWSKKGIKTLKDVEEDRKNFRKKEEPKEKVEIFDVDWLDDDEEEQ